MPSKCGRNPAEACNRVFVVTVHEGDQRVCADGEPVPRCFCRVSGDAAEAEAVVKAAVRGGLTPNASTYHIMTGLWVREEQLAGNGA